MLTYEVFRSSTGQGILYNLYTFFLNNYRRCIPHAAQLQEAIGVRTKVLELRPRVSFKASWRVVTF